VVLFYFVENFFIGTLGFGLVDFGDGVSFYTTFYFASRKFFIDKLFQDKTVHALVGYFAPEIY